jgi:LuxR family transcriptional regulator, maltose regulon positive regulatory protein
VAGLQLAGLALRDRKDPAAFVEAFTGGHRLVVDYLMAEVLERQPVSVRRFLLITSVLDRLCAPLCDALQAATSNQLAHHRRLSRASWSWRGWRGQPVPGTAGR